MVMDKDRIIVLDTNVILLDANNLLAVADMYKDLDPIICIPETVVEELDSKKSALGEVGYQAREFGRIMAKAEKTTPRLVSNEGMATTAYRIGTFVVHIVSLYEYTTTSAYPNLVNDDKIIETAALLNGTLLTNDIMCRVRAETHGVPTKEFRDVSTVDTSFTVTLEVSRKLFNDLHNQDIYVVNPTHQNANFTYMFVNSDTKETKLAIISNGLIKVIGKDTEKMLRDQCINPHNKEQLLFSGLIQDTSIDIVLCEALAGSGKSLMAISNAMKLLDDNPIYENIIYIRNTVDDISNPDEEIGFLKGNEEKMAVYLQPFYDTVMQIVRSSVGRLRLRGEELEEYLESEANKLVKKYNMSAMVALGLRGRTFDNSVIVIDEAQNISKATMQKILSRVGKNSKVIVIGSLRQIDSKYLTKYTSGLSVLLNATGRSDLPIKLGAVTLSKVVRGKITEFSEMVFSNNKKES